MLKFTRYSPLDVERQAAASLESLLERIPTISVQHVDHLSERIDFTVHVRDREIGQEYMIGCEVKSNGQPRYAENALLRLLAWQAEISSPTTLVFAAPYLSPAVRRMCNERGVGYLDLTGNCLIRFGPVYIERSVAETPPSEQRELKSIYKPKSARVLRVLLGSAGRVWKVKDLAEVSGVSLGHVSNVRNALRNRRWIDEEISGTVLTHPAELLDEWRNYYEVEGVTFDFYTTLHGAALKNAIRSFLNADPGLGPVAVMSSFSAADWIAPYGRTGKTYFYADPDGLERIIKALSLRPVKSGANVHITIPKDDGVFMDYIEPAPGMVCTSLVQTYLDLYSAGERGQEAAEHLREEKLIW